MVESIQQAAKGAEVATQNLLMLCDVQNLYYSARNAYSVEARVDFKKVREAAIKGRRFGHIISKAYFATRPGEIPEKFVSALQRLSYEVKLVSIRNHEQGDSSATNIDVMLATDALNTLFGGRDPDIVAVASGDSDFLPVYKVLMERGIRVEVLSFPASLSSAVQEEVHEIVPLTSDHLFDNFKDA